MPAHKGVVTLSNLCIQRIAQLFIDITKCVSQCSRNEKKEVLTSQKTEESNREQTSEYNNRKITASKLIQKLSHSSEPAKNGCTQTTGEHQAEESSPSLHEEGEEEDKDKRRKKQG